MRNFCSVPLNPLSEDDYHISSVHTGPVHRHSFRVRQRAIFNFDRSHVNSRYSCSIVFMIILQIDETIKNIYKFLQKLAVGLEQVVLDQTLYDGHFMEEFNEAEFKLKAVSFPTLLSLAILGCVRFRGFARARICRAENFPDRDWISSQKYARP